MINKMIKPYPGMKIYEDVTFVGGVYNFFEQEGIIICGDGICIDGNGAVLVGGKVKEETNQESNTTEFSYGYGNMIDSTLEYYGTGVHLKNKNNVTIKNLQVKGFIHGLYMDSCEQCIIENNDFSYNYHNPAWGWEEHKDVGGMLLINSNFNTLVNNTACNVFSALVMRKSNYNVVKHNCCSHTSNVGLRLWLSSNNTIEDNDFSWGLRKDANEVHARDSSCVLIESASNYNVFKRNDMRYGGDGLFIRSLNNMMSMYNVFEENDTSYANNNAIEAWDAHNTYIRNKANYSSYGFWLGCSDHSVLIGNEVIGNGNVFRNAPESFGNAGIAVVNGSGNDFILEDNIICDNYGPGIAIRHTFDVPSRNWIIKHNIIKHNHDDERGFHGYGIYLKNAMNIHMIHNEMDNESENIYIDEHASIGAMYEEDIHVLPLELKCQNDSIMVHETLEFEMLGFDTYETYFDDGQIEKTKRFIKSFQEPGRHRMFANGYSTKQMGCLTKSIYVRSKGKKINDCKDVKNWQSEKKSSQITAIKGIREACVLLSSQNEKKARFRCEFKSESLKNITHVSFYYNYLNDFIDWKNEVGLQINIFDEQGETVNIHTNVAIFQEACQKANEAKYEWEYIRIPLKSSKEFDVTYSDSFTGYARAIEFIFETPQHSTLFFKIDDVTLETHDEKQYQPAIYADAHVLDDLKNRVRFSSFEKACFSIFKMNEYHYEFSDRWISNAEGDEEFIQFNFAGEFPVDGLDIAFYGDQETTVLPLEIALSDGLVTWYSQKVEHNHLIIPFNRKQSDTFIIRLRKPAGSKISCYQCVWLLQKSEYELEIKNRESSEIFISDILVKLNIETWPKSCPLKDLQYTILPYEKLQSQTQEIPHKTLAHSEIVSGKETSLSIQECIKTNKKYALLLWIDELAKDVQEGSYYRWVGEGIAEINGQYGYLNSDGIVNCDKTGWGECYMKVIHVDGVMDHSCVSEGLGNRFGLETMEKLYQSFIVPNRKSMVFTADYFRSNGWLIKGKEELCLHNPKACLTICCYLKNDTVIKAVCNCEVFTNVGNVLKITIHEDGWQKLMFTSEGNEILFIE